MPDGNNTFWNIGGRQQGSDTNKGVKILYM